MDRTHKNFTDTVWIHKVIKDRWVEATGGRRVKTQHVNWTGDLSHSVGQLEHCEFVC